MRLCWSAVAGVSFLVGAARAEGTDRVLIAGTCMPEGVTAEALMQTLSAELSPLRVEPLTSTNVTETTPVLGIDDCRETDSAVRISVWNHGERRERTVLLADAAKGTETRALALALAEALRDPAVTRPRPAAPLPWLPPPRSALPLPIDSRDDRAPVRARASPAGVVPGVDLLFRYMPASSTPAIGAKGELEWDRFGGGLALLGARKSASLGTATLVEIAALASLDAFEFGEGTSIRVRGELGAAIAVGSPSGAAAGHTRAAVHAALLGGVAQVVPLTTGLELALFVGGGYASSLNADADGRRIAGLNGGFFETSAGVRL